MILRLLLTGFRRERARLAVAILGVAAATARATATPPFMSAVPRP